ncbi:MAG: septation ring formation regulator EzrA [Bacillaceae bacterium]|nr:septation ring formation regulator EzrA [Bacillaceae bacterium]
MTEDLHENKKQSYTAIKTMIGELNVEYLDAKDSLEHSVERLNSLRKDELKAKETIKSLKTKIIHCNRLVKKSNIPGLPETLLDQIEEADASLVGAKNKLDEIPIVMTEVNDSMKDALQSVEQIYEKITTAIEQAIMAEKVIQYGNRFRSRYSFIHEELLIAEEAFRNFDYEVALDISLTAIKKIDPTALDSINTYVEKIYH